MTTSVTIDDELRKKIKKLAAELDTKQGEIVRQAIEIFELQLGKKIVRDKRAQEIMKKAAEERRDIKWRQEIRKKLSESGADLDDLRISYWGEVD